MAPRTPFAVALKSISMQVRAGEVLAIAGVAGNGQGELFDALSGEYPVYNNDAIRLRGKPVGRIGINGRRLMGAGFVPEERHGHAAVPDRRFPAHRAWLSHQGCGATHFGNDGCAQKRGRSARRVAVWR